MSTLSIHLFSKFTISRNNEPARALDVHKIQEFFSYLLIFRSRPHQREALAGLFWGESGTSQSRKNLRQVLWQLQSSLIFQGCQQDPPVLLVEPDWVQVNPQANIWLDVEEFEKISLQVQGICGGDLCPEQVDRLRYAIDLYQGDLLEGWYQDWCLFERERLQNIYLVMLDKLIDYCEMTGDCDSGLAYGARILRYDRARERTHFQLMRLYCMDGNRTDAMRQYDRCVAALKEELSVAPAKEVTDLYLQVKADRIAPALAGKPAFQEERTQLEGPPRTVGARPASIHDLILYLNRLQNELVIASLNIQEEIRSLERSLHS